MRRRGITPVEVAEALDNVQVRYTSADNPTAEVLLGLTAAARRLKIVVRVADPDFVITVADRDQNDEGE